MLNIKEINKEGRFFKIRVDIRKLNGANKNHNI